jgi:hypothetical protein
MTRDQFNALPMSCGGDLWNDWKLARKVFRDPSAAAYRIRYRGTGLWVDVVVTFADGTTSQVRVYDAF